VIGGSPHRTPEERLRELAGVQYDRGISPRGFARQFAAILAAPARTRALGDLRVPTVVIHGAEDPLVPPLAGRLTAAQIPGARLAIVKGLGHDLAPSTWTYAIDALVENAHRRVPFDAKPLGLLRALSQRAIQL
jgi:pimeloyl-ACP methyl ester carboxylesterase